MDGHPLNKHFKSIGMAGLLVGLVCVGVSWAGAFGGDNAAWLQAYMYGWVFWASLAFGCLVLTALTHATKAIWGNGILRLLEAGSSPTTFILLLILMIPIFGNLAHIYPWADPAMIAKYEILKHRAAYMNPTGFEVRSALFLLVWAWYSWLMRTSTVKQDQERGDKETIRRFTWGAVGLVVLILTATFAFTDWTMSLDPKLSSTLWGGLSGEGGALSALSLCTYLLCAHATQEPFDKISHERLTKDLGTMLLVLTMVWGYFSFSQYLIIWSGNLPSTNTYYLNRSQNNFYILGGILTFGQFGIPFLLLMVPRIKRLASMLKWLALFIFVMRFFDVYNIVIPFFKHPLAPNWQDFIPLLGIGGLWFFAFGQSSIKAPLVQLFDTRLKEAAHHA